MTPEEAEILHSQWKGVEESCKFMRRHKEDYNPCRMNAEIIAAYISDNKLHWDHLSIEAAFHACKNKMFNGDDNFLKNCGIAPL